MTVKAVVLSILLCFVGAGLGVGAEGSCPEPSDILPCTCNNGSLGLVMDCSGVKDEPELAQVFAIDLPSTNFYELLISHDPVNPDYQLQSLKATTLGEATFERVAISGTQIVTIAGYALDKSKSTLKVLSLDGNRINSFPFEALPRYTKLTRLLLANNNLEILPQIISETLESLDVQGNTMVVESKAFERSPSLLSIDLSRTGQQSLQPGLFTPLANLQELDLSDNEITELEEAAIVTAASSMLFLDLSRNDITFVRHDSIVGLSPGGFLLMNNNGITELTKESWQRIFEQLQPDGYISLAENPLVCGCEMKWLVQNETYLNLLTDTTKCATGEMIIFLDPNMFDVLCP
ncbi:oplophorus-luciferin 2-monooxygenase non-catalytic subunit-like [Eriocheir sinensis]|uniref:oplophorus-luciferin 2-monooxygenase non-catalytic subunit-like n=1 Tax=Eriocheir sinensis TaxID=95602 RepID=UPI0021C7D085|nr:oplophorus-luciferin 2-monooxygenase non-catalytic subunit-like [Eriocheir sinensis]